MYIYLVRKDQHQNKQNMYKNEGIIGSEQVYECECAILNDFELYNVHAESAEI